MDLRFDTRAKKPTVWSIAFLSAVMLAGVVVLLLLGGEDALLLADLLTVLYCALVVALLADAFFKQLQYNPYSYNTIYYVGFALFSLSVFFTHGNTLLFGLLRPGSLSGDRLLTMLLDSAKHYMRLSAPFLLLFSGALLVSNVSLIRHEGKRLVNVLGIILSFLLLAGEAAVFLLDRIEGQSFLFHLGLNLFAAGYLYFECMLLGAIAADLIAAKYEPKPDKDFIIVLGCGIRKDGSPTPILRGRLERALGFAREQEAETGKAPGFVVSGGQGPDEVVSEAEAMGAYLEAQGVPSSRILREDKSTDTAENMRFSKEKIMALGKDGKIAYATTNYHVFRAGLKARRVKMRAVGMGSDTKWYFWPNAAVREFVGLLTEHRGKQALVILGIVSVYTALTLLAYGLGG